MSIESKQVHVYWLGAILLFQTTGMIQINATRH